MDDLIQQLHSDHHRLAEVLLQLDRDLVACCRAVEVEVALLRRLKDAITYIQEYPCHWHHPAEEAIFEKLLERDIAEREQIETILYEHDELENETRALIEEFGELLTSARPPADTLLERTSAMVARQLDHQQRESNEVYPLIARYLHNSEWQNLMHRIYALPHNAALQRHYLSLYHHLIRQHPQF